MEPPVTKASEDQELMFLYDKLREEILHNDELSLQILGATALFVGTVMSFAFTGAVQNPLLKGFLFFLAEVISITGWSQRVDRSRSTQTIASYMRIFIEAKMVGVKWETRLPNFQRRFPKIRHGSIIGHQRYTYLMFYLLNGILSVYYLALGFGQCAFLPILTATQIAVDPVVLTTVCSWSVSIGLAMLLVIQVLAALSFRMFWKQYSNFTSTKFDLIWHEVKEDEIISSVPLPSATNDDAIEDRGFPNNTQLENLGSLNKLPARKSPRTRGKNAK